MKIFQPMLFVGLGGTGGLVGAELERRLRAELCGPDGTALSHLGGGMLPYQLPDCLQFVYADFSEPDLARLPQASADPSLSAAFGRTSRATHDLLPNFDSSPEITRMLRARMHEEVNSWLPPRDGEPRVVPLRHGAGQLPTVGRAGLFGTLRNGLDPVLEPLSQAIDAIARSAGALSQLGGGPLSGCDVFVAFSVAGGTGAGIFLDYLYLINHAFQEKNLDGVKIYPLVVMPSAFPPAGGGGREAELNSARALVDLFRLVDEQNAPSAAVDHNADPDEDPALRIRYPTVQPVRLRSGVLPTAFLFSRTAGIRQDDLRRSMVSLVMSLVGTELGDGRHNGRSRADDDYQTFAASFINRGVQRAAVAASGIGRQGVSTSLVASMTAPVDELAALVSARILRASVDQLGDRSRRSNQPLEELVTTMFSAAGLEDLLDRSLLPVSGPEPLPRGGAAIESALAVRLGDMQAGLADLRQRAGQRAAEMAEAFNPRQAVDELLKTGDPFLLERVMHGDAQDPGEIGRLGFLGLLVSRSRRPAMPPGVREQPPTAPRIRRRLGGLSQARWGDEEVQAALVAQDAWYKWRSRVIWHEAWREQQARWEPTSRVASDQVDRLVSALRRHAEQESRTYAAKERELYSDRTGVSYLLPPQRDLPQFYEDLTARLISREGLRDTDNEAGLLRRMVDGQAWRHAHAVGRRSPDSAVGGVKAVLEGRVKRLFAESGELLEERPLLPSMGVLLAAAAGSTEAEEHVSREARDQFARKLAGLLPAGFTPEGTGPLKALVVYPRVKSSDQVEVFLRGALQLPRDPRLTVEFRGVDTESITVVLFRSEMSLTQVPEARKVLRQWAKAKEEEQSEDVLRWRQRLGYGDDWLVSTETDRRQILHRLLCALWNGQLDVLDGTEHSPERIRVRLFAERGPNVPGVRLRLGDYPGGISSWAELLRVYERWTVLDEEQTVEDYCRRLMAAQPQGLTQAASRPHPLFVRLVEEIAPAQLRLLEERRRRDGERIDGWVRPLWQFWAETLPAALDVTFTDGRAAQPTLRTLLAAYHEGELRPPGGAVDDAPALRPAAPAAEERYRSGGYDDRDDRDDYDTVPLTPANAPDRPGAWADRPDPLLKPPPPADPPRSGWPQHPAPGGGFA
ncbi:hypothetical protein GCM10009665_75030 [Kitasatospora nipponensis]|uniref:Tubulin-like protein n=1 Tax=Kitasatospora nipponensis TaxID=258049 RepID=A0ABP4DUH7_9ACTN